PHDGTATHWNSVRREPSHVVCARGTLHGRRRSRGVAVAARHALRGVWSSLAPFLGSFRSVTRTPSRRVLTASTFARQRARLFTEPHNAQTHDRRSRRAAVRRGLPAGAYRRGLYDE